MSRARAWGTAALLASGCLPPTTSEPDTRSRPELDRAPPPTVVKRATQHERPEPTPPPPTASAPAPSPSDPADSSIHPGLRVVEPGIQPGLDATIAELPPSSSLWAGTLAGNGGRDVLVYLPPDADDHADVHLVYHFHGTYSEHLERRRPELPKKRWVGHDRLLQTIEAVDALQRARPYNVALIYPFSAGKRQEPTIKGWWNGAYDRMWMDPEPPRFTDSFDRLHDDVVTLLTTRLGVHPTRVHTPVIAEGHSAGGIALYNIATAGTQRVGEYIFLDAGFQGWGDGCYAAVRAAGAAALVTLVITDRGIADPIAGRTPWCTTLEQLHARWIQQQAWCDERARATADDDVEPSPPGRDDCAALAEAAEAWNESRAWCEDMKHDMKNTPGVYVHRTKVYHGEQPRHFTGGLELPERRFADAAADGAAPPPR